MKRLLLLLLLALTLAPAFGVKVAMLIGCDDYLHFTPLKSCVADVQAMHEALKAAGYLVYSMTGTEVDAGGQHSVACMPTKGNIEHQLAVWAPEKAYGVGDTLLFFFSGHGVRSVDGVDYLAPLDGQMKDDEIDFASLLPMHAVYEQLRRSGAENLFIITDACRNEPGRGVAHAGGFGQNAAKDLTAVKWIDQRVALLRSCAEEQRCYEMPNGAGGYFTHFLTRGLSGEAANNGKVTAAGLCDFVKEKVRKAVAAAENQPQVPQFTFTNGDADAFVLADKLPADTFSIHITAPEALASGVELVCTDAQVTVTGYVSDAPGVELWYRGTKMPLGAVAPEHAGVRPFTLTLAGFKPGNRYEEALGLRDDAGRKVITKLRIQCVPKPPEPIFVTAHKINPKDGAEMIQIPAGEFLMGSPNDVGKEDEHPQHKVFLDEYYIYKNDVTVAQYRQFCTATGRKMPPMPTWGDWVLQDTRPIVNVSWQDAKAYADWAGAALPSEAQWEKAARGTDGRIYPWGNTWDAKKCACNLLATKPVGSYPMGASPYGVLDMSGNVLQWCADWYYDQYYKFTPVKSPTGPEKGAVRVARGGYWACDSNLLPSALRRTFSPMSISEAIGFRCVCVPPGL